MLVWFDVEAKVKWIMGLEACHSWKKMAGEECSCKSLLGSFFFLCVYVCVYMIKVLILHM